MRYNIINITREAGVNYITVCFPWLSYFYSSSGPCQVSPVSKQPSSVSSQSTVHPGPGCSEVEHHPAVAADYIKNIPHKLTLLHNTSAQCTVSITTVHSFVTAGRGSAYIGPQHWDIMLVQCASPGRGGKLVGVCSVCEQRVEWRRAWVGVNSLLGISKARLLLLLVAYCLAKTLLALLQRLATWLTLLQC